MKRRGTNFEFRTAYAFERFGYTWDRSGGSLGIDLKILKKGRLCYLVNCKKTFKQGPIYLPRMEVERLKEAANRAGVGGLVCFGFYRTPIMALMLDEINKLERTPLYYKLYPADGNPLVEFLKKESISTIK